MVVLCPKFVRSRCHVNSDFLKHASKLPPCHKNSTFLACQYSRIFWALRHSSRGLQDIYMQDST